MKKSFQEIPEFEGFEFDVSPSELAIDYENVTIYDDGTPLTGDVYKTDDEFNERMKEAEKNFIEIVKSLHD